MKKSDLKTGMVIETIKGERGIVMLDTLEGDVVVSDLRFGSTFFPLSHINEDLDNIFFLTADDLNDIKKIYNYSGNMSAASTLDVGELLFERK